MELTLIFGLINNLIETINEPYKTVLILAAYTILITLYSIFIWKFHGFLGSRDILKLNLNQYNYSKHPDWEKAFAVMLYVLEYIIILPFLVLFWFAIFSSVILLLSDSSDVKQILIMAAAIIAATRIASYVNENLSKDLAKIMPFTLLIIFLLDFKRLFDLQTIINKIGEIPYLFENIIVFIIFIFAVELIFRGFFSFLQLFDFKK